MPADKWPMIEKAAQIALKTFNKGATPDAAAAGSAITSLMVPLNALMGN